MTDASSVNSASQCVLTINGGSSSVKFALYQRHEPPRRLLHGKIDRIGVPGTFLDFVDSRSNRKARHDVDASDHQSAAHHLIEWLEKEVGTAAVVAVGHRVVHGGPRYHAPQRVTPELLDELRRIRSWDPDHLPSEIALIDVFQQRYPDVPHVACFDTAFHRSLPRVAKLLPIPRRFDAKGIQRYGFHGLSYSFLMEELARVGGVQAAQGRLILAHLGNGASLAAVRGGQCVDTSMGFTPAAGLPMGTRPGDLDPGVASYVMRAENLTGAQFNTLINHESGLLGISETSSDMRDLMDREATDARAAEAIELFCYQTRKWIGAFAAVLGGLDTLVFAGGIGENMSEVRERICSGLEFLGIEIDPKRNTTGAAVVSAAASRVTVRVVRTDEELIIAKAVFRILPDT
jgi:acetate kinase